MNTRFHRLTLLLVVLVTVIVLGYDLWISWTIRYDALLDAQRQRAELLLERIAKTSSNENLLKVLLDRFHLQASRDLLRYEIPVAKRVIARRHRSLLAEVLPAHDLMLWNFDRFRMVARPVFKHSAGLGFAGPIGTAFIRRMFLPALHRSVLPALKRGMREALDFPLGESVLSSHIGKGLQIFNGYEGRKALYFNTFPVQTEKQFDFRNMFAAVVDVSHLPADFWVKNLVRMTGTSAFGTAFIPVRGGTAFFSGFFRERPEMRREIISQLQTTAKKGVHLDFFPGYMVAVGQECGEIPVCPVVVYPLPTGTEARNRHLGLFILLLAVAGGALLLFIRAPRMPIGLVLLLVFSFITALPIIGVWTISRFLVSEENQRGEQEAGRLLHEALKNGDRDIFFRQSVLSRDMARMAAERALEESLREEYRAGKDQGLAIAMIRRIQKTHPWSQRFQGFHLVVGPRDFTRFGATAPREDAGMGQTNILQLMRPSAQKILEVLQERISGKVRQVERNAGPPSKRDIEYEMVREFLAKGLGGELGYNFINFPDRIQSIRMNVGQIFFVVFPLGRNRYPEFLSAWGWDEAVLLDAIRMKFRFFSEKDSQLFFITVKSQQLLPSPDGLEHLQSVGPRLHELARQSRDNNFAALRARAVVGTQTVVMETMPGLLTNTMYAGARCVGDPSRATRDRLRWVMTVAFGLTFVLAFFAMASFMAPLNRILRAIRRIGPGKYDVALEDSRRGDEFGTLAQAFNTMMNGLREKELLGKYVSDSVKQLVSGGGIQDLVRKGEQRLVSVLFSGIAGFEEIQTSRTPQDIFRLMNDHLSAMASAVKSGGGEISKVMGEKIMVVFDHDAMGGPEAVSAALVSVIRRLEESAGTMGFEIEIGVNSGPVIAGILGSSSVRLDYTVIGDTVNLASRLAVLAHITGGSRIVVSGATLELLHGKATATRLPFKKVKGKTQAVEVFLLDSY